MDRKGWIECSIGEACKDIFAGGDVPKTAFSKEKTESCPIPIFSNGVENDGLYGYTDAPRVTEPCVTISGRGTIGHCVLHVKPFYPIIRLISAIPKDTIDIRYFYYALSSIKFKSTGVTIPQLTVPAVKSYRFIYPVEIEEQQRIVAELDLLSSIVKKKNAQLKILDDLAMSIFAETFEHGNHSWEEMLLEDCINKVKYTTKLQTKDFLKKGRFPIVSQEEDYVSGYWNRSEDVFKIKKPVVVFGDHTRVLKYIDFDFVLGADGVRILEPIDDLHPQYFYYFLRSNPVENLGYSRHFKLLKEKRVVIAPMTMQKEFAEKIQSINKQKKSIDSSLKTAKDLFASRMDQYFNA